MRTSVALATMAALVACGDEPGVTPEPDARVIPAIDAPVEDLDMTLADFANIPGLMPVPGRNYRVANPLGHEADAIAVASSPTGGSFPVGSIVLAQPTEVMVKRRAGFNPVRSEEHTSELQSRENLVCRL